MRPPQCGLRYLAAAMVAVYESAHESERSGLPPPRANVEHRLTEPIHHYIERAQQWNPTTLRQAWAKDRIIELLEHLDGCEDCESP